MRAKYFKLYCEVMSNKSLQTCIQINIDNNSTLYSAKI